MTYLFLQNSQYKQSIDYDNKNVQHNSVQLYSANIDSMVFYSNWKHKAGDIRITKF